MKWITLLLVFLAIVVGSPGLTEANTVKKKEVKSEIVKSNIIDSEYTVVYINSFQDLKFTPVYSLMDSKGNYAAFDDCGYQGGKYYCCYAGGGYWCYPAPPPPPANP